MGRQFLVSLSGLDPCVIRHVVLPFHRADCAMAGLIVDRESCSFASVLWILSSRVEQFSRAIPESLGSIDFPRRGDNPSHRVAYS